MPISDELRQKLLSETKYMMQNSMDPGLVGNTHPSVQALLDKYGGGTATPDATVSAAAIPAAPQSSTAEIREFVPQEPVIKDLEAPEEKKDGFFKSLAKGVATSVADLARQPAVFVRRTGETIGSKLAEIAPNIFEQEVDAVDFIKDPLVSLGKLTLQKVGESEGAKIFAQEWLDGQEQENQSKVEQLITGGRQTGEYESAREFVGEGIEAAANIGTAFTPIPAKGASIFYKTMLGAGTGALQGAARSGAERIKQAGVPAEQVFRSALGGAGLGAAGGALFGALGGIWDKAMASLGEGKRVAGREAAQLLKVKKGKIASDFYWGNDTIGDDIFQAGYLKAKTPEGIRDMAIKNMSKYGQQIDDALATADDVIIRKQDLLDDPIIKEMLDDETFLQAVPGAKREIEKLSQTFSVRKLNDLKKLWTGKVSGIFDKNTGQLTPRQEFWYKMGKAARERVSDLVPEIAEANAAWGTAVEARILAANRMAWDYMRAGLVGSQEGGRLTMWNALMNLMNKTIGSPSVQSTYAQWRGNMSNVAKIEKTFDPVVRNFIISTFADIAESYISDDEKDKADEFVLQRIELD